MKSTGKLHYTGIHYVQAKSVTKCRESAHQRKIELEKLGEEHRSVRIHLVSAMVNCINRENEHRRRMECNPTDEQRYYYN